MTVMDMPEELKQKLAAEAKAADAARVKMEQMAELEKNEQELEKGSKTEPESNGGGQPMNPLQLGFIQMGAALGRDLGLLAVRAVEAYKGGVGAVLFYEGEAVKQITVQIEGKAPSGHDWVMIIPPGVPYPLWLKKLAHQFTSDVAQIADGSLIVVGTWKK